MYKTLFKGLMLIIIIISSTVTLFSQDFVYDWVRSAGGERWDLANDIVIDQEKNLYIAGGFEQTIFFGNDSLVSQGNRDIFIAKYDSLGNLLWLKSAGGSKYDNPIDLEIDNENNLLVAGNFQDSCWFESQWIYSESYLNVFVAKYTPQGNLQDLISFNADIRDKKVYITPTVSGNFNLSGTFFDKMNIEGDTLFSSGESDMFSVSFSPNLSYNNVIQFGENHFEAKGAKSLKDILYINEVFYIASEFNDSTDIDGNLRYSFGGSDVLLLKTDIEGNILSSKQIAGFAEDEAKSLIFDSDTNIYLAAEFNAKIFFDEDSLTSVGGKDILLIKTDGDFNTLWYRQIGSNTDEYADNLLTNTVNAVYLSGVFLDSLKINNKSIVSEDLTVDMFTAKYSPDGNNLGLKQAGGSGYEFSNKLINDQDNYLYIIGNFAYDFAFETDSISSDSIFLANNEDIFIARFYDCDYARYPEIGNDTSYCEYGTLKVLNPVPNNYGIFGRFKNYYWNNGQSGKQINVYDSGYYYVTTIDSHNCLVRSDSIFINVFPEALPYLGPDLYVSSNEMITLNGGEFNTYLWSNDSTTQTLTIFTENLLESVNTYSLIVTNEYDCIGEDEIQIIMDLPMYIPSGPSQYEMNENLPETDNPDENKVLNDESVIMKFTGVENKEVKTLSAMVYPNPNNGKFKININSVDDDIQNIIIYTAEGRKVYENKFFDFENTEINLQSIGSHYIIIETNNYLFFEKVIIQ